MAPGPVCAVWILSRGGASQSQVVTSEAVSGLGGTLQAGRGLPDSQDILPGKKLAKECRRWRDQEPQSSGPQPVLSAPVNFSSGFVEESRLLSCWLWTHNSLPFKVL